VEQSIKINTHHCDKQARTDVVHQCSVPPLAFDDKSSQVIAGEYEAAPVKMFE